METVAKPEIVNVTAYRIGEMLVCRLCAGKIEIHPSGQAANCRNCGQVYNLGYPLSQDEGEADAWITPAVQVGLKPIIHYAWLWGVLQFDYCPDCGTRIMTGQTSCSKCGIRILGNFPNPSVPVYQACQPEGM